RTLSPAPYSVTTVGGTNAAMRNTNTSAKRKPTQITNRRAPGSCGDWSNTELGCDIPARRCRENALTNGEFRPHLVTAFGLLPQRRMDSWVSELVSSGPTRHGTPSRDARRLRPDVITVTRLSSPSDGSGRSTSPVLQSSIRPRIALTHLRSVCGL